MSGDQTNALQRVGDELGDLATDRVMREMLGQIRPRLSMWARRRDDGSIAWLSDGFAELFGRDPAPYIGRTDLVELVHPDDRELFDAGTVDIADQVLLWRLVRPDDEVRWVRSQVVATIEVPVGEHFWVGVMEDVTDEVADRLHRQQMEVTFAELTFVLNDADATEVDGALDHGLRLLGELVRADRSYVFRLHGEGLLSNTHEWCAPGVEPAIGMLQSQPAEDVRWALRRLSDGPQVISVAELPGEAQVLRQVLEAQGINSLVLVPTLLRGDLVGFVGFDSVRDARQWCPNDVEILERFSRVVQAALARAEAERRRRESLAELVAARQAAETASAAMSRLLSRVSHELRTPASTAVTSAELLSGCALGDDERAHVDRILQSARQQLSMIDDLLQVARAEHRSTGHASRVDLARLARQLLDVASDGTDVAAGLRVTGEPTVIADPELVRQVVSNLVSNAVKYNRPGGRVDVDIAPSPRGVTIAVSDTGPGIDPVHLDDLWEPFERLGAESGDIPGTGLGLAIARRAAEELGGSIEVGSTPDGSCFTVHLPDGAVREGPDSSASVLLVDDHDAVRTMMDTLLRHSGGFEEIRHARSCGEAIDEVARGVPSVVLLDRHLPDGLGETVIGRLRSLPGASSLPVVVLSADATEAAALRSREAGADAFVVKPARVSELVELVRSLVVSGR